ncbi:MAG: SPOR domain-containing protein, partial [Bacteroidia bacterium]|nr:SPOR domain-containing protein [Bacteroidia bacterium]
MRIPLYISELLYVSDCVIIPGLGGFVANSRSAFLNPAQHTFSPPVRRIAFNASLRTNDGLLANYVSRREGITYGDAVTKIKYFVEDV